MKKEKDFDKMKEYRKEFEKEHKELMNDKELKYEKYLISKEHFERILFYKKALENKYPFDDNYPFKNKVVINHENKVMIYNNYPFSNYVVNHFYKKELDERLNNCICDREMALISYFYNETLMSKYPFENETVNDFFKEVLENEYPFEREVYNEIYEKIFKCKSCNCKYKYPFERDHKYPFERDQTKINALYLFDEDFFRFKSCKSVKKRILSVFYREVLDETNRLRKIFLEDKKRLKKVEQKVANLFLFYCFEKDRKKKEKTNKEVFENNDVVIVPELQKKILDLLKKIDLKQKEE